MLITLTTDFGYQDPFVGIMKGVIATINPRAQVIDIAHGVPAQDILAGALILQNAAPYFPAGTIHVAVVDPGVGGARQPLLVESQGNYFIGPDNGVLSLVPAGTPPKRIIELSNPEYQLKNISQTFHGRDIFAPAAAYLSAGVAPAQLGTPLAAMTQLAIPQIIRGENEWSGEIIYIDGFGNLFTNLRQRDLTGQPRLEVEFAGRALGGLVAAYSDVGAGQFACLWNSWGLLEIAVNGGSAQQRSGAKLGDRVNFTVNS